MKKFITVLLVLGLLVMPGTQGLLAQDYSENSLPNELTLPQIEPSQEQAADDQGKIPDEQGEVQDEQEPTALDDDVINEELIIEPPPFSKKSLTLEEKNEEIDKVLREVSANATVAENVYGVRIAAPTAMGDTRGHKGTRTQQNRPLVSTKKHPASAKVFLKIKFLATTYSPTA